MGKKYEAIRKLVDREKRYTLAEAVELLPKLKFAKFDETIDVAARLGVKRRPAPAGSDGAASAGLHPPRPAPAGRSAAHSPS